MQIVTSDLETFWSATHSLSKMNPIDYVMHKDTELISNSLKINDGPSECVFGEEAIRAQLSKIDWNNAFFIQHNGSEFDAMIYAWRLGIRPRIWGCTLAMARPIHGKTIGVSLATLVKHYGIGVKNNATLLQTKGKHLCDFTQQELRDMAKYNCDDTDQCFELFKRLRPHYTTAELWHLDSKIRSLVEPKLMVDVPLMEAALAQERANKRKSLLTIASQFATEGGIPRDEDSLVEFAREQLASAPKFSAFLESRGVPVPMKDSPSVEGTTIPALAKSDLGFLKLMEHEDEIVAMAAAARVSVKSTIAETRLEKFINVAGITGGKWPVTVSYCGAITTGRSSGWYYNPLNLPRVGPKPKPADAMRMGLMAPPGYKVVVVDASGIEMRFNHFLWNVRYSTELWNQQPDADIYKPTAAKFFMIDVASVTKDQRQVGKAQQLSCGYGCGATSYVTMARTMAGLHISEEAAQAQVNSWRDMTPEIANWNDGGWTRCEKAFEAIINEIEQPIDPRGIFTTCAEGIRLPSGRIIRYPSLRRQKAMRKGKNGEWTEKWAWLYGEKRHQSYIWGSMADENLCQAGARDVVYDAALQIFKRTGHRPVLEVYDELVYVVPEDQAEQHLAVCHEEMRRSPTWFPDLVLWSEGDIGDRYGACK